MLRISFGNMWCLFGVLCFYYRVTPFNSFYVCLCRWHILESSLKLRSGLCLDFVSICMRYRGSRSLSQQLLLSEKLLLRHLWLYLSIFLRDVFELPFCWVIKHSNQKQLRGEKDLLLLILPTLNPSLREVKAGNGVLLTGSLFGLLTWPPYTV